MTRELLIDVLDEIALLLDLKGENPFKIRAYRQCAETIRQYDGAIVALAQKNELNGIKGIGEALQAKLHELATTGTLEFHQQLRAEFPEGLFELFDLQGLGPKKIKALHDQLGVHDLISLKAACENHSIAKLVGFGAKTQEKILQAIDLKSRFADQFLLGGVSMLVEEILELLRMHPEVTRVAVAGSYRRAKETVHDLDFLVATRETKLVCEDFTTLPHVASIIACGETKASVRLHNGLMCDLRAVTNTQFPFALQYFSGSKEHNVALRSLALKRGLSLNEYGFSKTDPDDLTPLPTVHEESEIYQALDLQPIPAELRENRGEIEAAAKNALPRLIEWSNLRGTFHNHTTASDGIDSLAAMAEEALDLGLEYLGIADHSKSSFQANGLDEERLMEQIKAIKALNATYQKFRIFSGSEVDILKDGSLDFSDEILQQLDYCVASVHQNFSLNEDEMTQRMCRAMENPHVTMIGHLTGRLLLKRESYAINHEKIIDCAAETRTILELNCSPMRLDLDWRWLRRARDRGVLISINPDAHSRAGLHHLALGARVARKGWLTRQDVINTRKLDQMISFLTTAKAERM
ncbi:MAG: DNA polymerase/3'-5' exonuclease PolX [Verrucomicrobia bacterium]|nr:MAG: DNA polymerase/3'-5' exonuclease PolX [Verrucomicrobiota bacterium]